MTHNPRLISAYVNKKRNTLVIFLFCRWQTLLQETFLVTIDLEIFKFVLDSPPRCRKYSVIAQTFKLLVPKNFGQNGLFVAPIGHTSFC